VILVLKSSFQVLLNPTTQDNDAMEGLGYISDLLIRCKVTEVAYLGTDTVAPPVTSQRYTMSFLEHCEYDQILLL
jgi:hypothetical protein